MDPETTGHTTNNTEKKYEMNSGGGGGWVARRQFKKNGSNPFCEACRQFPTVGKKSKHIWWYKSSVYFPITIAKYYFK